MMHSLKILMISPQFRPIVGGYEIAAERLSVATAKRGHKVCVLTERRSTGWDRRELFEGVSVIRWWCMYKKRVHVLSSIIGMTYCLLAYGRRYDIWHVHQYGAHATIATLCAKVLRRPIVLKLTSTQQQGLTEVLLSSRAPALSRKIVLGIDAVVSLTQETSVDAISFGIHLSRIHKIGNGVDVETFRPRSAIEQKRLRKRLGLADSRIAIYAGRLAEEKNLKGLLQSWNLALPKIGSNWLLCLIGDGPLRQSLEQQALLLGLKSRVIFLGYQSNVSEWLGASNLYILSSNREGLSNTLLEAMATGLPSVSSRVSGVAELVEQSKSGIGVTIGDSVEMANAIVDLATDSGLQHQMGGRARAIIEKEYSIEIVAKKHEELYLNLFNSKYC